MKQPVASATGSPFFSVIIPTYNRGHLIARTIQSVLGQQFDSYEVLVIDDGSNDDTKSVVEQFKNEKVFYFYKQNGERGAARNFGWREAKGEYVTFLDSDDIFYPTHFITAFEQLKSLSLPFCFAQAYEITEFATGKQIHKGYHSNDRLINKRLLQGNMLACFGVFIKCIVRNEIVFEEERRFAGTEDWLLWLQLAARHPFYFHNEVTGALTYHKDRSVWCINEESLIFRPVFFKQKLQQDSTFLKTFGQAGVRKAYAHVLSYVSLNLAMGKENKKALRYLLQTLKVSPKELFKKRTLGIFKKILFK